jgi:hypothetical protein
MSPWSEGAVAAQKQVPKAGSVICASIWVVAAVVGPN